MMEAERYKEDIMKAIRLYREDVYLKETTGRITSAEAVKKGTLVTLDRSLFFPEGGGQSCDRGTIAGFPVLDVQEKDDEVYHLVECRPEDLPKPGSDTEVLQILDWDRRFDNMQRHCGEHIVSGIFFREYGGVNRGFHMGEDYMTIDISLEEDPDYDKVTWDMCRHVELLAAGEDTYLVDTPGFTSLWLQDIEPDRLHCYYPEFEQWERDCRFSGCVHINEPDCAVKDALARGQISRIRYRNYCELYDELRGRRPVYTKK